MEEQFITLNYWREYQDFDEKFMVDLFMISECKKKISNIAKHFVQKMITMMTMAALFVWTKSNILEIENEKLIYFD